MKTKQQEHIKSISTIFTVILLILVMINLFLTDATSVGTEVSPYLDVSSGWKNVDTGEIVDKKYVEVLPGADIKLSRTLPENLNDDNVLGYYDYGFRVMAFVDDEKIYSLGGDNYGRFGTEISQAWRTIPLAADYSGRKLTVIWENDTDSTMRIYISEMRIGYSSSEVVRAFTTSWVAILVILGCAFLGILLIIFGSVLLNAGYRDSFHCMVLLAVFILTVGLWSWANSSLSQLLLHDVAFGYKLAYLVYPLIPMFLGLFYERVYKDHMMIYSILNSTYRFLILSIYILYLTGLVPLAQSMFLAQVYLYADLLLGSAFSVINFKKNRSHVNHWALVGQVLLLLIAAVFIPMYYLKGLEHVFLYAGGTCIIFTVCMAMSQGVYMAEDLNKHRKEREVREQTCIDPITGGNSRSGLVYYLKEMDLTGIEAPWFVLMELINFSSVNELFSFKNSGPILKGIYETNEAVVGEKVFQAMAGDSDFAFLVPAGTDIDDMCRQLAVKLQQYMEKRWENAFLLPRFEAVRVNPGDDFSKLMACTRLAYSNRDKEKDGLLSVYYYDADCADKAMKGQILADAVNRELIKNRLELRYVPVFDTVTGRVCQADTLLCWNGWALEDMPDWKLIPPTERKSLLVRMNETQLRLALETLAEHPELKDVRISVGILTNSLKDEGFQMALAGKSEKYEAGFGRLNIDVKLNRNIITEPEIMDFISEYRQKGVTVTATEFDGSIEKFTLLKKLKPDCVKFIPDLLENVDKGEQGFSVSVSKVVRDLHEDGNRVLITEVNYQEDVDLIKALGIEKMSGKYLGEVMTFEELMDLINGKEGQQYGY